MKTRYLAIVATLLLALAGAGLSTFVMGEQGSKAWSPKADPAQVAKASEMYKRCLPFDDRTLVCLQEVSLSVAEVYGPPVALEAIDGIQKFEPRVGAVCHPVIHAIGKQSFLERRDVAYSLRYMTPICDGGYQHGVYVTWGYELKDAEAAGKKLDPNVFDEVIKMCNARSGWGAVLCYHGIGHAAWLAKPSSDGMVPLCVQAPTQERRESCFEGHLMEWVYPSDRNGDASSDSGDRLPAAIEYCNTLVSKQWTDTPIADGKSVNSTCRAAAYFLFMSKVLVQTEKFANSPYSKFSPFIDEYFAGCETLKVAGDDASLDESRTCKSLIGWVLWYVAGQNRDAALAYCENVPADTLAGCRKYVDIVIERNTNVAVTGGGAED